MIFVYGGLFYCRTLYINSLVKVLVESDLGCHLHAEYVGCLIYADDILLLPLTPKYVTLNDLESPFCVKFCFVRYVWSCEAWLRSLATLKLVMNVIGEL